MNNLLIIESPNKIHTISKFLDGNEFKIIATIGHIRDLPTNSLGFDEKTLTPKWIIPLKKTDKISKDKIINEIKAAAKNAKKIFLATDPDREGEAISWHVYNVLPSSDQLKCSRITFNEITKTAIQHAISNPRELDIKWVESQFARRILDRLVGYKISKILRNMVHGKSAGRVQSIALKLIYDRENEINLFKPTKWWTIDPIIDKNNKLFLREIDQKIKDKINAIQFSNEKEGSGVNFNDFNSADLLKKQLSDEWKIYSIDDPKYYTSKPKEPYKTSTLQQDGVNKLGWSVSKVMSVAQKLYEGVKIDNEYIALISYPRTDSVRISETFANNVEKFIIKTYGNDYFFKFIYLNKKNEKNVQNAHEAVRVIDPFITPESIKSKIKLEEFALYQLIWSRTIAAFMAPAKYETTIVRVINNGNKFYTYSRVLKFLGYKKVYNDKDEIHQVPIFSKDSVGSKIKIQSIFIKEHSTLPPPRFSQATLIKELDGLGIGRPSTYKSMVNMPLQRGYAELTNKNYHILPLGIEVVDFLKMYFSFLLDTNFTNEVETDLDNIADGKLSWKNLVKEMQPIIEKCIKDAKENFKLKSMNVGRDCPLCKSPLIYRYSHKNGTQFIGCSSFPKCKYVEFPNNKNETLSYVCPNCGNKLILRKSKFNRYFVGCSNYPKCKFIMNTTNKQIKQICECLENNQPLPNFEIVNSFHKNKSEKKDKQKR